MYFWLLAGIMTAAYAVFAHISSSLTQLGAWVVLLAAAPVLIVAVGYARASRWGVALFVLLCIGLGYLLWAWPSLSNPISWVYFLQHFVINTVFALVFGRTLAADQRPLVTTLASKVHPEMTPELLRYTRQVTIAWTCFFVVCVAISTGLFILASIEAWSVFVNLLSLPMIVLMFLLENEVRKRVLPPRDQLGIVDTVRAFRANFRS